MTERYLTHLFIVSFLILTGVACEFYDESVEDWRHCSAQKACPTGWYCTSSVCQKADIAVGTACSSNQVCGEAGICLTEEETSIPYGYCTIDCSERACPTGTKCFNFGEEVSLCLLVCGNDSSCRTDEGYECDEDKTCWPIEW